jgi:hypothetical protein
MGEWRYSSVFLDLSTRLKWVVSFMPLPLYPHGKSPQCPLDRKMGEPYCWSGSCREEKNLAPPRIEHRLCPACSLLLHWLKMLTHAIQPWHGERLVMRTGQSSLHIYVLWREGAPCILMSQGTGNPVGPQAFVQHIQICPPYQMGSLMYHPRAGPSRGYRFLQGII